MFRRARTPFFYVADRSPRGSIRLFSSMTILAAWQQLAFAR